jgi:hypothetical protein
MWFGVSVWLEGCHENVANLPSLWEEVVLLIQAETEAEARTLAEASARDREHGYQVSKPSSHTLRWTFRGVSRTCEIEGEPGTGTEVFARFLRPSEVESLRTAFDDE